MSRIESSGAQSAAVDERIDEDDEKHVDGTEQSVEVDEHDDEAGVIFTDDNANAHDDAADGSYASTSEHQLAERRRSDGTIDDRMSSIFDEDARFRRMSPQSAALAIMRQMGPENALAAIDAQQLRGQYARAVRQAAEVELAKLPSGSFDNPSNAQYVPPPLPATTRASSDRDNPARHVRFNDEEKSLEEKQSIASQQHLAASSNRGHIVNNITTSFDHDEDLRRLQRERDDRLRTQFANIPIDRDLPLTSDGQAEGSRRYRERHPSAMSSWSMPMFDSSSSASNAVRATTPSRMPLAANPPQSARPSPLDPANSSSNAARAATSSSSHARMSLTADPALFARQQSSARDSTASELDAMRRQLAYQQEQFDDERRRAHDERQMMFNTNAQCMQLVTQAQDRQRQLDEQQRQQANAAANAPPLQPPPPRSREASAPISSDRPMSAAAVSAGMSILSGGPAADGGNQQRGRGARGGRAGGRPAARLPSNAAPAFIASTAASPGIVTIGNGIVGSGRMSATTSLVLNAVLADPRQAKIVSELELPTFDPKSVVSNFTDWLANWEQIAAAHLMTYATALVAMSTYVPEDAGELIKAIWAAAPSTMLIQEVYDQVTKELESFYASTGAQTHVKLSMLSQLEMKSDESILEFIKRLEKSCREYNPQMADDMKSGYMLNALPSKIRIEFLRQNVGYEKVGYVRFKEHIVGLFEVEAEAIRESIRESLMDGSRSRALDILKSNPSMRLDTGTGSAILNDIERHFILHDRTAATFGQLVEKGLESRPSSRFTEQSSAKRPRLDDKTVRFGSETTTIDTTKGDFQSPIETLVETIARATSAHTAATQQQLVDSNNALAKQLQAAREPKSPKQARKYCGNCNMNNHSLEECRYRDRSNVQQQQQQLMLQQALQQQQQQMQQLLNAAQHAQYTPPQPPQWQAAPMMPLQQPWTPPQPLPRAPPTPTWQPTSTMTPARLALMTPTESPMPPLQQRPHYEN